MIRKIKMLGFAVALLGMTIMSSGCFWLAVGAAAGAGGYAWVRGQLVKDYNISAERLYNAAVKGLKDLGTPIMEDTHDRLSAKVTTEFSDGEAVVINIAAVTEKAAKLKIRVGVFGNKTRSEMILSHIEKHI